MRGFARFLGVRLAFGVVVLFFGVSWADQPQVQPLIDQDQEGRISVRYASMNPEAAEVSPRNILPDPPYVPDEVLFRLKNAALSNDSKGQAAEVQALDRVVRKHSLNSARPLVSKHKKRGWKSIYRAKLKGGATPPAIVKQLEADPDIEWAEPNYYRVTQAVPNDPSYGSQTHLPVINAPTAWDVTTGDPNVVIAIIDTGVDWTHPDLAANIWQNSGEVAGDGIDNDSNGYIDDVHGWDFVSVEPNRVISGEDPGPPDNNPMDFEGHGTHVAGIVGAVGNNGVGVTGVCWNARIMPLRAGYKKSNGAGTLEIADVAAALMYAANNGAHIVNMSFGSTAPSRTELDALNYCTASGVLLVAAAGNNRNDQAFFPAAYDNVIAVAAGYWNSSQKFLRSDYSNYGIWVDIAAPGDVYSTLIGGVYGTKSGTSMASPVVAGVAGLIKAAHFTWTAGEIRQQLQSTASNVNAANPLFINLLGGGLVNAYSGVTVSAPPTRLAVVSLRCEELTGDFDGELDPGEQIRLLPSLRNFGPACANATVTMTTTDPYLTIVDGSCTVASLTCDDIKTNWNDPMTFQVDPNIPQNDIATLTFEIALPGVGAVASETLRLPVNPLMRSLTQLTQGYSSMDYYKPHVFSRPNGEVTVVYHTKGFVENLVYAQSRDLTGTWTSPQLVTNSTVFGSANDLDAVIDRNGRVHVCFMGYRSGIQGGQLYHASQDPLTGAWSSPVQVSTGAVRDSVGYTWHNMVAADPAGHPWILWVDGRSGSKEIYYVRYDGAQWTTEAPIPGAAGGTTPSLVFESDGTGHLTYFHSDEDKLYTMKWENGVWGTPVVLYTSNYNRDYMNSYPAVDSADQVHLAYGYMYRRYDGANWLGQISAPLVNTIVMGPGDHPYMIDRGGFGDWGTQMAETVYGGTAWSALRQLTVQPYGSDLIDIQFAFNSSGDRFVVGDTPWFGMISDIFFLTDQHDPSLLPSRPVVSDGGEWSLDRNYVRASLSTSHPSGICRYQYAIGTAPGEADVSGWNTIYSSLSTLSNITLSLTSSPLPDRRTCYLSIKAKNNKGYWSAIGTSDGITWIAKPMISGHVDLQDFVGDRTAVPVTVEVRPQSGTATVRTVNLDADGNYTLADVDRGTYSLAFSAGHWLKKVVPNVSTSTVGGDLAGVDVSLVNGDANNDNKVNFSDYLLLSQQYGESGQDLSADFTGDGVVDFSDYLILSTNFDRQGDN